MYGTGSGTPGSASSVTVTTGTPKPRVETHFPAQRDGYDKTNLYWSAVAKLADETVTGYRIDESNSDCSGWSEVTTVTQGTGDTSIPTEYTRTGVTRGEVRCYRVRAESATKQGAWSTPVRGTTLPRAPEKPEPVLTPQPNATSPTHYILSWAPVDGHGWNVQYQIENWESRITVRGDGHYYATIPASGEPERLSGLRVVAYIDASKYVHLLGRNQRRTIGAWSDTLKVADGSSGAPDAFDPFSGLLRNSPARHDGSTTFTFELHFSRDPGGLGYRDVRDDLFEVTGGRITNARRAEPPSNQTWTVSVAPTQTGRVTITLPARDCSASNAVCAGDEPLAEAATVTVDGPAFTGSFSGVPGEHAGSGTFTMEFHLSEAPRGLGWRVVRDHLFEVSGGTIARARRIGAVRNKGWELTVAPSGKGDVTLTSLATASCDDADAVCTSDGRMLEGGATATVAGPLAFSVADASVDEAAGAKGG